MYCGNHERSSWPHRPPGNDAKRYASQDASGPVRASGHKFKKNIIFSIPSHPGSVANQPKGAGSQIWNVAKIFALLWLQAVDSAGIRIKANVYQRNFMTFSCRRISWARSLLHGHQEMQKGLVFNKEMKNAVQSFEFEVNSAKERGLRESEQAAARNSQWTVTRT